MGQPRNTHREYERALAEDGRVTSQLAGSKRDGQRTFG
jgi:hypothetical protein